MIEYAEKNNILINLNINHFYNIIINGILKNNNIEMMILLVEYAERNKIKIKYFKSNFIVLNECEKLIQIADKYKNVFEYVNE